MTKYSQKVINTQLNDTIIKAAKLSPLTQQLETFKLVKVLAPFSGSVLDGFISKDRSLVCASAMTLLASNATEEHFEALQVILLGSILGNDNEPLTTVENINAWLESHADVSSYDLLLWLGTENFYTPLTKATAFQTITPVFNTMKDLFSGLVKESTGTPTEVEGITQGDEDVQKSDV